VSGRFQKLRGSVTVEIHPDDRTHGLRLNRIEVFDIVAPGRNMIDGERFHEVGRLRNDADGWKPAPISTEMRATRPEMVQ
jgi:hypothetical protein